MDDYAEDLPRGEQPVPEVEVERTSVPDLPPPVTGGQCYQAPRNTLLVPPSSWTK